MEIIPCQLDISRHLMHISDILPWSAGGWEIRLPPYGKNPCFPSVFLWKKLQIDFKNRIDRIWFCWYNVALKNTLVTKAGERMAAELRIRAGTKLRMAFDAPFGKEPEFNLIYIRFTS